MSKKSNVSKENERRVGAMNWKRKRIILTRLDDKICEEYKPNADGPVYVHYLPAGCSLKGATMHARLSSGDQLAEQVIMEVEEKLQIQSKRVLGHPLKIKRNVIVLDSLETGNLYIFEPNANGSVYVQHSSDGCCIKGATLAGRIGVNILPEVKTVIIDDLYCKYGYEVLANPMIEQVQYFVDFYEEFDYLLFADL